MPAKTAYAVMLKTTKHGTITHATYWDKSRADQTAGNLRHTYKASPGVRVSVHKVSIK